MHAKGPPAGQKHKHDKEMVRQGEGGDDRHPRQRQARLRQYRGQRIRGHRIPKSKQNTARQRQTRIWIDKQRHMDGCLREQTIKQVTKETQQSPSIKQAESADKPQRIHVYVHV